MPCGAAGHGGSVFAVMLLCIWPNMSWQVEQLWIPEHRKADTEQQKRHFLRAWVGRVCGGGGLRG